MVDEFSGLDTETLGGNTVVAAQVAAEAAEARAIAEAAGMGPTHEGGWLAGIVNWATGVAAEVTLSEQELAFLDALGATPEEIAELANQSITIQQVISERSPGQLLEALGESYPDSQNVIGLVGDDANLSEAFHNAIVQDPTMLEGLQSMMSAGEGEFNLSDLETALQNETTRGHLTRILERVAEGQTTGGEDVTFAHVRQIMNAQKNNDQAAAARIMQEIGALPAGTEAMQIGIQFFMELMQDPEAAVYNLVNTLQENGMIDEQQADMILGFAPEIAGFAHFMAEPYHQIAVDHNLSMQSFTDIPNSLAARGQEFRERFEARANGTEPRRVAGGEERREMTEGPFERARAGEIDPEAVSANPVREVAAAPVPVAAPAVGPA